jgi:hypothetical protein
MNPWVKGLIAFVAFAVCDYCSTVLVAIDINWKLFFILMAGKAAGAVSLYMKTSPMDDNNNKPIIPPGIKLMILVCPLMWFCSCSSNVSTHDQVVGQIQNAEPYIRPSTGLVCGAVLTLAVSGDDRIEKAKYIDGIAKAVRSLATGQVPSVDQLKSTIALWAPDKAHWADLSTSISSIYGGVFPMIGSDGKLAATILENIALGCEDAAAHYVQ